MQYLKDQLMAAYNAMQEPVKLAGSEKRELTAVETEKFEKANADYDRLKLELRRHEKASLAIQEMSTPVNALPGQSQTVTADVKPDAKAAFREWAKTGNLPTEYRANAGITLGSIAGFAVDEGTAIVFSDQLKYFGGILNAPGVEIKKTNNYLTLPFFTYDDTANTGTLLAEGTAATINLPGSTNPTMAQKNLNAYMIASNFEVVSLQAIDSIQDFDQDIAKSCGIQVARKLANLLVTGTGGGTQHTGIVNAATSSYTSAHYDTLGLADIVSFYHSIDKAYRDQPSFAWVMNDSTIKQIRLMVDGNGRPLYQSSLSGLSGGKLVGETLLDKPLIAANDMPAMGAASTTGIMAAGAWSYFTVRFVDQVISLRATERFAEYLAVGILFAQASDSNLRASNAIKLMSTGTVA